MAEKGKDARRERLGGRANAGDRDLSDRHEQSQDAALPRHARARAHVRPGAREKSGVPLPVRVILVSLLVGLMGSGAFFLWRHATGAAQARDTIISAMDAIAESDEGVVPLNEVLSSSIEESVDYDDVAQKAKDAAAALNRAEARLAQARSLDEFLDDEQRSVLTAIEGSIEARRDLIGAGQAIVSIDADVAAAKSELDQAMDFAVRANDKAQQAAKAANEYAKHLAGQPSEQTDASVAVGLDQDSVDLLKQAQAHVSAAKGQFDGVDYTAYEAYLEKRLEAAEVMLQADTAVLAGDFEGASTLVNTYNEADARASELAGALPASTSDVYKDVYADRTRDARKAYADAQRRAAETDELLRRYRGVSVSSATNQAGAESGAAASADEAGPETVAAATDATDQTEA